MIELPENGYTPANYQTLVSMTALNPKRFYEQFGIPERTFYNHKSGNRSMGWQEWQYLLHSVEQYLVYRVMLIQMISRLSNRNPDKRAS